MASSQIPKMIYEITHVKLFIAVWQVHISISSKNNLKLDDVRFTLKELVKS